MSDPFTAQLIMTAVMTAASMAVTASQKIKGPRLDDLSVSMADYGARIPRLWGTCKFQPQVIWADKLREEKKTSKTKGGKYSEYKYYGSWAVLICDQEIDAVSRIWFDKHLVYQRTAEGPVSLAAILGAAFGIEGSSGTVKISEGQNMRVYLGTETQMPDPLIEAWCEDRYGADSCPAYRGSAYIVWEDIPLEKFGNRIPQITVEAVRNPTPAYISETIDQPWAANIAGFTSDFSKAVVTDNDGFQIIDVASRQIISAAQVGNFAGQIAINADGSFYDGTYANVTKSVLVSEGGNITVVSEDPAGSLWRVNAGLYGRYGSGQEIITQLVGDTVINTAVGFYPSWYFDDVDGDSWAFGGGTNEVTFLQLDSLVATEHTVTTTSSGDAYAMDNGGGGFFVFQNNKIYVIDKTGFTITAGPVAVSYPTGGGTAARIFRSTAAGDMTVWIGFTQYSTRDLSVIQTQDPADWTDLPSGAETSGAIYDRVNDALWTHDSSPDRLNIYYLNRVGSDGVTLATVVDEVSEWVGLTDQDTSELTQTVLGYSVTQGPAKDMIAPLLDIHDVDARPHDFGIQFKTRGSAPSGSILTEDFVRQGDRYVTTITQDTDLPRRLTFNFADNDHDQQTNTVIAQRPLDAADSQREETIDLSTYVDTPNSAQQKADRYFRRIWNSRERTKNGLTPQKLGLEPADVTTISLDGLSRNVRLDKMTITPTQIDCEWVRDETSFAAVNTATTGPEMEGRDPEIIIIPGPTKGFILDAPLIEDSDSDINPLLYVGAGSYGGTWTGAVVWRGDDGSYDDAVAGIEPASKSTWGYAGDALANANPNLWDRGNSLDVTVYGTLTSVTEAEIDADPSLNMAALGIEGRWEYLNFTTATLTGTQGNANLYTLSGFKRGRRGTEMNVSNHEAGDVLVMVNNLAIEELGAGDIGDDISFKVQTSGRNIDGAPAIDMTYTGATLKPYAPARIKWSTDGTDLFGEIIRRTRVGGAWNGGSTIPLSENSEAYEVDVLSGLGAVLDTIEVTGTNTFTITGAELTGYGYSLSSLPDVNVYQMSDVAGRGFALAA